MRLTELDLKLQMFCTDQTKKTKSHHNHLFIPSSDCFLVRRQDDTNSTEGVFTGRIQNCSLTLTRRYRP